MKPATPFRSALKFLSAILILGFIGLFLMAMKARQMADDVWKQLGIAETQANMNMKNSFIYGDFYYGGAKQAKNIATGNRQAVIKELMARAKKYYSSNEFKTAYLDHRKRAMPAEPERIPITAEQIIQSEKYRLEKNLKTAEAGLNSDNPKIKNSAPSRIEK